MILQGAHLNVPAVAGEWGVTISLPAPFQRVISVVPVQLPRPAALLHQTVSPYNQSAGS